MAVCTITGNLKNISNGSIDTPQPIFVQLNKRSVLYNGNIILKPSPIKIIPSGGSFTVNLLDNTNMTSEDESANLYYIFTINGKIFRKIVPDQSSADFDDLDTPTTIEE